MNNIKIIHQNFDFTTYYEIKEMISNIEKDFDNFFWDELEYFSEFEIEI